MSAFAAAYNYTTTTTTSSSSASAVFLVIYLAILLVLLVGMAKMYRKAGQPAWGVIIPFYNLYLLAKIAGRPGWWLILQLIPLVNLVVSIIMGIDIAKRFGHGTAYGVIVCGLLGIGYALLGYDSSTYSVG